MSLGYGGRGSTVKAFDEFRKTFPFQPNFDAIIPLANCFQIASHNL